VDPKLLQKYPAGTLLLTLTHPECEEVRIGYHILPEFEFRPPSILLFNVEPNRPVRREVWLVNNYGEDFEITSCTSAVHLVEVVEQERVPAEDQKSFCYHLRLAFKPPPVSGDQNVFGDTLILRVAGGRTLQLPCRLFYSRPQVPFTNVRIRPH